MQTIWKYAVVPGDMVIQLPPTAQILCVHLHAGQPQMWVLLDPEAPPVLRHFAAYGTGHPIPAGIKHYIGTFVVDRGLVFHLFEVEAPHTHEETTP
jgi:hypothetical protein